METINNNVSPETKKFLNEMSDYIGCKLYFYGSVQRADFFPEDSDIDIDIFTNNLKSTLSKLETFLNLDPSKVKRIYMFIDNKLVKGYKFVYTNNHLKLKCEISVFNNYDKKIVLQEHTKKTILPFYVLWLMIILKTCFYTLHIIDISQYKSIKNVLLSTMIGEKETPYLVVKKE